MSDMSHCTSCGKEWVDHDGIIPTCEKLTILLEAIKRSGYDVSPCMQCGEPTVCLPDGLPCCDECGRRLMQEGGE